MAAKETRRGRPVLGDVALNHALTIKVSPAQHAEWIAAARDAGVSLGAWIRAAVDAARSTVR